MEKELPSAGPNQTEGSHPEDDRYKPRRAVEGLFGRPVNSSSPSLDLAEMPPEETSHLVPMRQEADMPSAFDSLESRAWNGLSKHPLAPWGNDGILGPRENKCRNIDFPEAVADVECF